MAILENQNAGKLQECSRLLSCSVSSCLFSMFAQIPVEITSKSYDVSISGRFSTAKWTKCSRESSYTSLFSIQLMTRREDTTCVQQEFNFQFTLTTCLQKCRSIPTSLIPLFLPVILLSLLSLPVILLSLLVTLPVILLFPLSHLAILWSPQLILPSMLLNWTCHNCLPIHRESRFQQIHHLIHIVQFNHRILYLNTNIPLIHQCRRLHLPIHLLLLFIVNFLPIVLQITVQHLFLIFL